MPRRGDPARLAAAMISGVAHACAMDHRIDELEAIERIREIVAKLSPDQRRAAFTYAGQGYAPPQDIRARERVYEFLQRVQT